VYTGMQQRYQGLIHWRFVTWLRTQNVRRDAQAKMLCTPVPLYPMEKPFVTASAGGGTTPQRTERLWAYGSMITYSLEETFDGVLNSDLDENMFSGWGGIIDNKTDVSFTPSGKRMDAFLFSQMYGTADIALRRSSEYIASTEPELNPSKVRLAPRSMMFPGIVSTSTRTGVRTVAVPTDTKVGIVMWRIKDTSQKTYSWPTEVNTRRELMVPSQSACKAPVMPNRDRREFWRSRNTSVTG
jgi:hypothetical protein